jgi:hypothetical protein
MAELISAIIEGVKFLAEAAGFVKELPSKKKREFFENYVAKINSDLLDIHRDYTQQFLTVLKSLQEKRDLREAIRLLKMQRPNKLLERQEVVSALKELQKQRMARRRQPKLSLTFYEYVEAVEDYLTAASPLPYGEKQTWYTEFIDLFENLYCKGEDPFSYNYPSIAHGSRIPQIAIETLERAVQQAMPSEMQKLQALYFKLKTACIPGA